MLSPNRSSSAIKRYFEIHPEWQEPGRLEGGWEAPYDVHRLPGTQRRLLVSIDSTPPNFIKVMKS